MKTRHLLFFLVVFGTVSHCVDWLLQNLLYGRSCPQTQRSCYLFLLRPFSVILPLLSLTHHLTAFLYLIYCQSTNFNKIFKDSLFFIVCLFPGGGTCVWEQRPQHPPPGHTVFPSLDSPPLRSCLGVFILNPTNIILVLREGKGGGRNKKRMFKQWQA